MLKLSPTDVYYLHLHFSLRCIQNRLKYEFVGFYQAYLLYMYQRMWVRVAFSKTFIISIPIVCAPLLTTNMSCGKLLIAQHPQYFSTRAFSALWAFEGKRVGKQPFEKAHGFESLNKFNSFAFSNILSDRRQSNAVYYPSKVMRCRTYSVWRSQHPTRRPTFIERFAKMCQLQDVFS